jgi:ATP-dependent DNA helicase PIF1
MVLLDISGMLQSMGKDIKMFNLPDMDDTYDTIGGEAREVIKDRAIEVDPSDEILETSLNPEQRRAYEDILAAVDSSDGGVFFVDGPGGTGKTFLYKALLAKV